MASVKSVTKISDRPWKGGLRKKRYEIVVTDNDGTDHTFTTPPIKRAVVESELGDRALAELQDAEQKRFSSRIRRDRAVDFQQGKWNTTRALFLAVATEAFKADHKTDELPVKFIPYLDQVTDAQLRNLAGKNQTWVNNVRAKAVKLATLKTAADDYTPEDVS